MEILPTPFDNLDPETQKIAQNAQAVRDQNVQTLHRIQQMGGDVDITTARLEHFMQSLVSVGVLTDYQMYSINLDWEKSLRGQLQNLLKVMQDRARAAKAEAERPKLIVPGR